MRRAPGLCGCVVLAMVASCGTPDLGFAIALTIDADQSISDAALAMAQTIDYHVTGDESYDHSDPIGHAMKRVERVVYRPGTAARALQLTLTARDGGGVVVGSGASPVVQLEAGKTTELLVVLTGTSGLLDGGTGDGAMTDSGVPSCNNAEKDGDETGLDCGGSCPKKCSATACAADDECITGRCDTVCVLATGPPSWLPEKAMPGGRVDTACATRTDGQIMIIGGNSDTAPGNGFFNTLLHVPGSTDWATGSALAKLHNQLAVATDQTGKIYAIGGRDGSGNAIGDCEVFAFGAWSIIPSTATAHAECGAALAPDGRILIVDSTSNEAYSVSGNTWSIFSLSATPRDQIAVATGSDGLIYSYGGLSGGSSSKINEAYDSVNAKWFTKASLSAARNSLGGVAAPDGRLYAIGGGDSTNAFQSVNTVEAYTPEADRWTAVTHMQSARQRFGACLAVDGRIFAPGGLVAGLSLNTVEVYGPLLTFSPGMPAVGNTININLHNFATDARFRVTYDGATAVIGTTNGAGDGFASFLLPAGSSGDHQLAAVDVKSAYPVHIKLHVN